MAQEKLAKSGFQILFSCPYFANLHFIPWSGKRVLEKNRDSLTVSMKHLLAKSPRAEVRKSPIYMVELFSIDRLVN